MQVALLTIGDELLLGQVLDSNSHWIANYLYDKGLSLDLKATVKDDEVQIVKTLEWMSEQVDVILITGGLGPTKDDLTLSALAKHLGVPLVSNPDTVNRLEHIYQHILQKEMSSAVLKQAFQPEGAKALDNQKGTAPGIFIKKGDTSYFSMPGVPREMMYLMQNEIVPLLTPDRGQFVKMHRTIHTIGWGETQVAELIEDLESSLPPNVKFAYLPSLRSVRLRIDIVAENAETAKQQLDFYQNSIVKLLPKELVFGFDDTDMNRVVHQLLKNKNWTLSTAESCTGGAIAEVLVKQAGASQIFKGSVVAYENKVKEDLLGVPRELLKEFGAVSEQTVIAMVKGAIKQMGSHLAIATSGIAGPTGGTTEKPVGTVWIAAGNGSEIITQKLSLKYDREGNISYTTFAALNLIRRFITKD